MANWENDSKIPTPGSPQYWSTVGLNEQKFQKLKQIYKKIKFSFYLGITWNICFFTTIILLFIWCFATNLIPSLLDSAITFIAIGICVFIVSIIINSFAIKTIAKISNSLITVTILYKIQLILLLSTMALFAQIGSFTLLVVIKQLKIIINNYN